MLLLVVVLDDDDDDVVVVSAAAKITTVSCHHVQFSALPSSQPLSRCHTVLMSIRCSDVLLPPAFPSRPPLSLPLAAHLWFYLAPRGPPSPPFPLAPLGGLSLISAGGGREAGDPADPFPHSDDSLLGHLLADEYSLSEPGE